MSVTLKGNPITLNGQFPQVGATATAFRLVAADLSEQGLDNFAGQRKVLNIFPSVDITGALKSLLKY